MKLTDSSQIEKMLSILPPRYPEAKPSEMQMIWGYDFSTMKMVEITCVNHPKARWITKDPVSRSLHFIQGPNGVDSFIEDECSCPYQDLRVVVREKEATE